VNLQKEKEGNTVEVKKRMEAKRWEEREFTYRERVCSWIGLDC
jgi:hypothetical protein